MRVTRAIAALTGACIILAACGYFAGRGLGGRFMEVLLLDQARFPLLLSRPVNRFYDVHALIHSGNPYSRLGGYYGLADNGMINLEFLAERFRLEKEPAVRGAIAWIAAGSGDTDGVLRLYASVFPESSHQEKRRILELMRRVSNDYYLKFIKENRVGAGLLPYEGREFDSDVRF